MNDNSRIKKAPSDTEQPLVQKESVSDAESCLSEMKKISQLIETVSQPNSSVSFSLSMDSCFGRCQFY
jgi:hypothetical protein